MILYINGGIFINSINTHSSELTFQILVLILVNQMRELTTKDKLFFFEKHFFTLDGLWMIEAENIADWDTALEIDLIVWKKLLKIVFRRIKKHLNITGNTTGELVKILTFRWAVEGWDLKVENLKNNEVYIEIQNCPYKSAMDRNPERQDKIPLICNNMCKPFYKNIISNFNSEIELKRNNFMGLGGKNCDFHFILRDNRNSTPLKSDTVYTKNTIQDEDKLFYFERNFRTLDGLWVIETEKKIDFQTALELDVIVWQRLYQIVFRRVKKYLSIEGNSLDDLTSILSFIWNCEGNYHKIVRENANHVLLKMTKCPYIEAMLRNPERHEKIESICKKMCIPYLEPVIMQFNPNIKLKRTKFIGLGDKICDFDLSLET